MVNYDRSDAKFHRQSPENLQRTGSFRLADVMEGKAKAGVYNIGVNQ
jgi:hypothetical protein